MQAHLSCAIAMLGTSPSKESPVKYTVYVVTSPATSALTTASSTLVRSSSAASTADADAPSGIQAVFWLTKSRRNEPALGTAPWPSTTIRCTSTPIDVTR